MAVEIGVNHLFYLVVSWVLSGRLVAEESMDLLVR